MDTDLLSLDPRTVYKLLCAVAVPRPTAWVTTLGEDGTVNAAPYSFFNIFGERPALVVLGLQHREDGTPKDTTRNIARTGEFVVNIVTPELKDVMVETAAAYPPERGEPEAVGLDVAPSSQVAPPRLAAAPAALECRKLTSLSFSAQRDLLIGEAVALHTRDGLLDPETMRIEWEGKFPLARLFGDRYARLVEIEPAPIPAPKPL
ncbi:MAG: nitrilotriacetate monooxygenase [Rhodobacteraceae bacterium]|nr:nitrilotriacetate monooxygenase [Paracoccaceae bacterium]MBR26010.1 nitrilotriacetate monooxygenase [Paracoccaceae bacterium]